MPIYTIEDTKTGRRLRVEGDSPPTEEEAEQIFAASAPELVVGTGEEARAQRERNLQRELGLSDSVNSKRTIPVVERLFLAAAPTPQERIAAANKRFGQGNYIPISDKNAIVRVPKEDGDGFEWVVENPRGLDAGDVGEAVVKYGPEAVAGYSGAAATSSGGTLLVPAASAAVAGQAAGAIKDVLFRKALGGPNADLRLGEIASRRLPSFLVETAIGWAIPKGLQKLGESNAIRRGAKEFISSIERAGREAKERLLQRGVKEGVSSDLGGKVTAIVPAKMTPREAGEAIADALTRQDEMLRAKGQSAQTAAFEQAVSRGTKILDSSTSGPIDSVTAGAQAIANARTTLDSLRNNIAGQYEEAYARIAADVDAAGMGQSFVELKGSKKLIDDVRSSLLVAAKEGGDEASALYAPMLATLNQLEATTSLPQKLAAVKQFRAMVGEKVGSNQEAFPGLAGSMAKRLYEAVSKDIKESVSLYSKEGARMLDEADAAHAALRKSMERSPILNRMVNPPEAGGYPSPEKLVDDLMGAGVEEWKALPSFVGPEAYNNLRRAAVNRLMGGALVDGERQYVNLPKLADSMRGIEDFKKDLLFGGRNNWEPLQKAAEEASFLYRNRSLFSDYAHPTMDDMANFSRIASELGYDKANKFLRRAIKIANARRDAFASNLIAQIRNGKPQAASSNMTELFEGLVLSGKYEPKYVNRVLRMLPPQTREELGKTAFQTIFSRAQDKVQDAARIALKRQGAVYNLDKLADSLLGSANQRATAEAVLGQERFNIIADYIIYRVGQEAKKAGSQERVRALESIVARLPYPNLLKARLAGEALEQASGRFKLSQIGPEKIEMFAKQRVAMTRAAAAGNQAALRAGEYAKDEMFNQYLDFLAPYNVEQQQAIEDFLLDR